MSLKRLLNPSSDDLGRYHQPQLGWDHYGAPIDAEPILQDQTWPHFVYDLLGENVISEPSSQVGDVNADTADQLCRAQEHIEQWAANNIYSASSNSAATTLDIPANTTSGLSDEQICYGMIYRASVKLMGNMVELDKKISSPGPSLLEGHHQMGIQKLDGQYLVTFLDGGVMGELNTQLEKVLDAVSSQLLDLEVVAPKRAIREIIEKATKEREAIVRVNINVYGKRGEAQRTGQEFSKHKVYLQRPDCVRHGINYDNPHVLKLANVQALQSNSVMQVEINKKPQLGKADELRKIISAVYSSLKRGEALNELEGDQRLTTTLLPHQKEALDFMSQREDGPIPEEFRLWKPDHIDGQPSYRNVVTNTISRIRQDEEGGGILADEMGMGKTLSILALIIRTLDAAQKWASTTSVESVPHESNALRMRKRTKATLVIASTDLMINEWMQEMDRHFDQETNKYLKTIKYHGQNKESDMMKLRDADIIITTYHTLASDFASKRNRMNALEWYRLVLDEAHIIRRQSTILNRTVSQLKARSRWCLTGTPIQNRLEDIGTLFAFLRVSPFHSLAMFRKCISIPYAEGGRQRRVAIERFAQLLDSLCLRRTKDRLHLPEQHERLRRIIFSPEEREQYEHTSTTMSRAVRNQVGTTSDHTNTLGLFQVQLQLRILCNHGTYQQPYSWNKRKLIDETEAVEMDRGAGAEVTCSVCKETMPRFSAGSIYKHYIDSCKHVLCSECITDNVRSSQQKHSENVDKFPSHCPLCFSNIQLANGNGYSPSQQAILSGHSEAYFRPYGRSSKMEALVADVQKDLWTTKSIIFSCWTHTLDLIQLYLTNARIYFQRIDGECPTARREKIIEDFAHNPQLRVMIMTTGTGAVGLNLAMANRVFLVEPQWNPSVEAQAIARAQRLGQSQTVQVTRYVVEKTVEQDMQSLQDKKREIAEIAWE